MITNHNLNLNSPPNQKTKKKQGVVRRRSLIRSQPLVSSTRFHGPAEKVNSHLAAAREPFDPRISIRNGSGADAAITLNTDTSKRLIIEKIQSSHIFPFIHSNTNNPVNHRSFFFFYVVLIIIKPKFFPIFIFNTEKKIHARLRRCP